MRLSDESVMEGGHLTPEERIALQAEEIKQLQQENEQLQAQVARMREALKQIALYDEYMTGAHEVAKQALSDTPADYHNPADVEALRKAREALCKGISELKVHCKYFDNTPEEDACIMMHEAVIEIDKAIGGGDVDKG